MVTTWISNTFSGLFYSSENLLEVLIQSLTGKDDVKQVFQNMPRKDLEKLRDKANEKCSACMIEKLRSAIDETLALVEDSTSVKITTEELYMECLASIADDRERNFVETVVEVFRTGDLLTKNWKPEDVGLYFLDLLGYCPMKLKPNRVISKIKKLLFKVIESFDKDCCSYDVLSVYKLIGFLVKYGVVKKDRGDILELIIGFESYISSSKERTKLLDKRRQTIYRITNLAVIGEDGKRLIDDKPQQCFDSEMVDWVIICCRRFGYNPRFDREAPYNTSNNVS